MIISEAIKTVMKKTGYTQREMANKLGVKSANHVGALLSRKNFTTEKTLQFLDILGYDLVLKPKNAKHLDDEIIITSSK